MVLKNNTNGATSRETTTPTARRPYEKPAILEEEQIETYTLACAQPPIPSCNAKISTQ